MIVRGEKDYPWEFDQSVIECCDGFHVKVVGWLIQDQDIRTGNHHLGKETANLFSTRKDTDTFHAILTWEKHTSKEASHISCILDFGVLGKPVCDGEIIVKFLGIILGKICLSGGDSPFIIALIRLHFSGDDLKESGDSLLIGAHESNFILAAKCERNIIQYLYAVDCLGKIFYHKDFVSNLTVGAEVNVWIFTAGRTHVIQLDLFQGSLTGGSLLGLGGIGAESGNKLL